MRPSSSDSPSPRQGAGFWLRALTLVLIVPGLVVLGWAAFGLQGYQNDPESKTFQTWPAGVASICLAVCLAWIALKPSHDPPQRVITGLAVVAFLVSWILVLN